MQDKSSDSSPDFFFARRFQRFQEELRELVDSFMEDTDWLHEVNDVQAAETSTHRTDRVQSGTPPAEAPREMALPQSEAMKDEAKRVRR